MDTEILIWSGFLIVKTKEITDGVSCEEIYRVVSIEQVMHGCECCSY